MRLFRLSGTGRAAALELLHARCDVHGVWEQDDATLVWLHGGCPDDVAAAAAVEELDAAAMAAPRTGLEDDGPILVAADLLVRPPWVPRPEGFDGIELVVPRGSAFGSGEHGSTRAALLCLHQLWHAPVASCLDVGTGSGILALYASVRGTPRVLACDIDPAAVAAARGLLPAAQVWLGGPEAVPETADLVVANMTGNELAATLAVLQQRWTRRRALVLSGMRQHEVASITAGVRAQRAAAVTVDGFTALGFAAQA